MARTPGSQGTDTGRRIRDAAVRLFARDGYAAVSMRQLAAEVGVQAGALYVHIPDKQTLLFDLLQEHMQDRIAAWEAVEKGETPLQRLEVFTRFHIGFHRDHPDAEFISEMELRNLSPDNRARIDALRARYEAALRTILSDGAAAGQMRVPDEELAATALLSMLRGVDGWCRAGGRLAPERVERISWNMVRRAVGA